MSEPGQFVLSPETAHQLAVSIMDDCDALIEFNTAATRTREEQIVVGNLSGPALFAIRDVGAEITAAAIEDANVFRSKAETFTTFTAASDEQDRDAAGEVQSILV